MVDKYYKKADKLVRESMEILNKILGKDGEDISYMHESALDRVIIKLIEAKSNMSIGDYREEL